VPTRDESTPATVLLNAVSAAEEHAEAARVLVEELAWNCHRTRHVLVAIASGHPCTDAMRVNHSHEVRPALFTAIRLFEKARHRLRLHLVRVADAEAATDSEICELWRFSYEMVRRIKEELLQFESAGVPAGGSERPDGQPPPQRQPVWSAVGRGCDSRSPSASRNRAGYQSAECHRIPC